MNVLLIPPLLGLVGMVAALIVYRLVMKYPDGQDKVKKIGDQIHNGALAFMKTEYKYLLAFMSVLVVLVYLQVLVFTLQLQLLLVQPLHLLPVSLVCTQLLKQM